MNKVAGRWFFCRTGLWTHDRLRRFVLACRWINEKLGSVALPTHGVLITSGDKARASSERLGDWVSEATMPPQACALVTQILKSCRADLNRWQELGHGMSPYQTRGYAETAALAGLREEVVWARKRLTNTPFIEFLLWPPEIVTEIPQLPHERMISREKLEEEYPTYNPEVVHRKVEKWTFEAASLSLAGEYERARQVAVNTKEDQCGEDVWFVDCLFAWKFPERVFDDNCDSPRDGTHDMRVPTAIVEFANRSAWCECEILLRSIAILSEVDFETRLKMARGIAGRIPSDLYPMI